MCIRIYMYTYTYAYIYNREGTFLAWNFKYFNVQEQCNNKQS